MNVQTMDNQQAELPSLYGEISSGASLTTPSDNPLGAAQAVQLSVQGADAVAIRDQSEHARLTNLQSEDSTLSSVITALQSVNHAVARRRRRHP